MSAVFGTVPGTEPGAAVTPLNAVWLLTRLRMRRQLNLFASAFRMSGRGKGKPARSGSAPKAGKGMLIALGMGAAMMLWIGMQTVQAAANFACRTLPGCQSAKVNSDMARAVSTLLHQPVDLPAVLLGFSLLLALLSIACVLIPLGSAELTQDWDLEWLITLPVGRALLLGARVLERSIVNSSAVLSIWPTLTVLAWYGGWGFWSPLAALAPTCALLLIIGAGRALGDTGLRMLLAPAQLRNLQALLSIASIPFMLLVIVFGMPEPLPLAYRILDAVPAVLVDTPFGLAVRAVYDPRGGNALAALGACVAAALATAAATVALLTVMLRKGINAGGAREAGRARAPAKNGRKIGSALMRRELLLLGRDRNYLVQTLVLPMLIIATQVLINGSGQNAAALAAKAPLVGAMAFSLATYVLMQSAFKGLNTEGAALWILYTVPRPLLSILREKIILWSVVACLYALPVFALAAWINGGLSWDMAASAALVLLGLPIYAAIAGALGIFGCDPLSQNQLQRVRPTFVWLYFVLCGLYAYALFAPDWWRKLVLLIFSAGLAVSLWQKARDRLPYLLDPAASPPARVSTADGMIGAMLFMVLQGLIGMLMAHSSKSALDWSMVAISFGASGAITVIGMLLAFGRRTQGVPVFCAARPLYAAGVGAVCGGAALAFALAYLWLVKPANPPGLSGHYAWFVVLAVVMAPLAEEFIFRGLLYGGLRRSYPEWVSVVGSSALFAAVHPAASLVPVFGLGVLCALAYRKTGSLLAPILAHALYNALLVALA